MGYPLHGVSMETQTQNQVQAQTPKKWVRIKVPAEIREYVKARAQARGMAVWQYIVSTIDFYESAMREKELRDITKLQNDAWYATKLTASITEFIHKPNDANYEKVMKIISQIETRKHILLTDLKTLVGMYRERRKKSLARAMLQACTRVFVDMATAK